MAITPDQEQRLTQGGDCHDHWHSTDRLKVHADIASLQSLANVKTPDSGAYSIGKLDDFVLSNNYGPFSMPKSKGDGREIEFVQITDADVRIDMASGDTFYGDSSILLEEKGTSIRLKAISGGWIAI